MAHTTKEQEYTHITMKAKKLATLLRIPHEFIWVYVLVLKAKR